MSEAAKTSMTSSLTPSPVQRIEFRVSLRGIRVDMQTKERIAIAIRSGVLSEWNRLNVKGDVSVQPLVLNATRLPGVISELTKTLGFFLRSE